MFRERFIGVVQEAVLIGVRWSVIFVLSLWALSWALSDYGIVRQRALNGQQAFEFIQQQIAQQKAVTKGPQPE